MNTKLRRDHPHAKVYCNKEIHGMHFITGEEGEKQYCTACGSFGNFYPTKQYRCADQNCKICNECKVCEKERNNCSEEEVSRSVAIDSKRLEDLPQNLF